MPEKVIHLREDSETEYGDHTTWCKGGGIYPTVEDRPEKVNCRECLEVIIKFAAECAERLKRLDEKTNQTKPSN